MEYITIDFETANGDLTSACSVGLVGAENGKVIWEKYFLINPHEPFLAQNIMIHGITEKDVQDAKTFDEVWDEVYPILNNNIVFAHCAQFDIAVLKSLLDKYHLQYPNIKIGCTLKLSRIIYKDVLPNFRLNTISGYLEVEHNHHNAISDAYICYYIVERAKRMYQVYDVYDLFKEVALDFGILNNKLYQSCRQIPLGVKGIKPISNILEGKIFAFTGKPKKFTKTEFKKIVGENGGLLSRAINRVINTFVIFQNPKKCELEMLKELQNEKEILVLNEDEFMRLVYGK